MAFSEFLVLFLLVLSLVGPSLATYSDRLPERLRHGKVYQNLRAREAQHYRQLRWSPNTTKNFFPAYIIPEEPSKGTFQDKFYYDMTYYNVAKPRCMFYLNGEAPLGSSVGGYMIQVAQQLQACTVTIEHRWYGESLPGPLTNKALLTQSLKVQYAMADVAALIQYFQKNILRNMNVSWILVGGSYSGAFTIWMNERYPGLFQASWSASGVVRASFDYTDYDGHIKAVTSRDCSDALERIQRIAERKWDTDNARLLQMFGGLASQSKSDFMYAMADCSAASVQYGMKTQMCYQILPQAEDDWAALQQYANFVTNDWGAGFFAGCYYNTACLSNSSMSDQWSGAGYSWIYQCCSEMAYFQTGYPGSIRSRNVSTGYFMDQCRSAFYPTTYPDTWAYNKRYHGMHPQTQGYIVATQGSDDPWSTTGLRYDQGPTFPVHTAECNDCGHCGSMMSPNAVLDPPSLVAQRTLISSRLAEWMAR